ncbi:MAG: glycosyltransferase family 4 protein [Tepidisphaeraceae bacterium]
MFSTAHFKGCDIAIEAYKAAARNVANLQLVAFGQHHPNENLALPPGTDFHYRPAQDKIPEIYASCDAWLFSSRSEGFGLPILEAMACRTPVIGVPTGAAPELISRGGGVLVKPQDPIDLARAIERLGRLPVGEWKSLSDAAYATAQANNWSASTELFEASLLRAAGA